MSCGGKKMSSVKWFLLKTASGWWIKPEVLSAGAPVAGQDNSTVYAWLLLTTGVTAAVLLCDVIHRYYFKSEKKAEDEVDGRVVTEVKATLSQLMALTSERQAAAEAEGVMRLELAQRLVADVKAQVAAPSGGGSPGGPPTYGVGLLLHDLLDVFRSTVQLGGRPGGQDGALEDVAQLEQLLCGLSHNIDLTAERGSGGDETDAPEAEQRASSGDIREDLSALQSGRQAVREQWSGVRRLLYCVDVHLKNAAHYHQYYYEVEKLLKIFHEHNDRLTAALESDVTGVSGQEDLNQLSDVTESGLRQLELWGDAVSRLAEEAATVIPVYKRTQPLSQPTTARALCSYTGDKVRVGEGDALTVTDNTSAANWQVATADGQSGGLPSVVCLLPPPDPNAKQDANRLRRLLREVYVSSKIQFQRRLLAAARDTTGGALGGDQASRLEVILPANKELIEAKLTELAAVLAEHCGREEGWPELEDKISELRELVQRAREEGQEAEGLLELIDMLSTLGGTADTYKESVKLLDSLGSQKGLHYSAVEESNGDSEWDTLEDIEQAKREIVFGVSVSKETTSIGETSTYESATGETRSTFSIRGVLDTRDYSEISMADAIEKGLIDQSRGVYINPKTAAELSIPEAMGQGFILVDSTHTSQDKERRRAVGLVTVKFTRETRPYTIRAVLDPRTDRELPVTDAVTEGIYDPARKTWCNPGTGEELSLENAIDCGALIVDYDVNADVTEPEVSEKTFAVFGVLDRKLNKRLPFFEAVERGLLEPEAGQYVDTLSGERLHVVEAFKQNFVKGRVVDDPRRLEFYLNRSGSQDSLTEEP